MTSIPLAVWPYNLASLAWVGIIVLMFLSGLIGINIAIVGIIICFAVFCIDALLLGPLWQHCFNRRK